LIREKRAKRKGWRGSVHPPPSGRGSKKLLAITEKPRIGLVSKYDGSHWEKNEEFILTMGG